MLVMEEKIETMIAYLAPRRLDEALQAMADGDATVLCGGTDLAPQTESGARQYKATLLNIRRIEGLDRIETTGDEIRIGAAATINAPSTTGQGGGMGGGSGPSK